MTESIDLAAPRYISESSLAIPIGAPLWQHPLSARGPIAEVGPGADLAAVRSRLVGARERTLGELADADEGCPILQDDPSSRIAGVDRLLAANPGRSASP